MNKPLMKLYQAEWCPYCGTVREQLEKLEVPYLKGGVPAEKSMRDDLLNISGQSGIPSLFWRDVIISDDDEAILGYLRGRFATHASKGR